MDGHDGGERQLVPVWSYKLVVLSFCISWIGAYTSTQLVIHAKYSRTPTIRWLWTFLASVAFGFTAIWSMHFVGMLACGLDVQITLDIPLTIVSAVVAILFTFAAFSSGYASEAIENSGVAVILSKWSKSIQSVLRLCFCGRHVDDLEAGSLPIAASEAEANERRPMLASFSDHGGHNADEEEEQTGHNSRPWDRQDTDEPPPLSTESESAAIPPLPPTPPLRSSRPLSSPKGQVRTLRTVLPSQAREGPNRTSSGRTSEESASTPLTEDSSEESASLAARRLSASSHNVSLSDTTLSSHSWSEPLHAGLSREARIRIKAQSRDRPVPEFGWKYWLKAYYKSITFLVAVRATIWGIAIVFMHYCGMWAMEIPEGRISWDWRIVILSYIVAFTLCFVGCIAMVHMEVHFLRQVAFSTIVAFGCCSMHYTGMWAATFYTRAPPSPDPGYPAFLPFAVLVVAIFVCVISNAVLAHSAILSRNRLAEIIITKRRFWRIMAEKEAAEQANELKQQFISVASHEIRTPLHAVNGYCELLAMTALTEEQAVYVSSIQQACHAINVIAGNVLDFSKLDRNNVELSARPVLVNLRKMAEDQARIIETKGTAHPQPAVDLIVSVASAVPQSLYLDETYTFRILMNLLSNAQKFCEDGYVCVVVSMDSDTQVSIKVSDTGCGIPKSFRNSLFQPFRQADSSLTRPKQGTGLGLSIVKHLVQRMSGTVDVESVEGEGSTFTVKLPTNLSTSTPPRPSLVLAVQKRLKVIYRHQRTARLFVDLWKQHGLIASMADSDVSFADLVKDTDIVWADRETVSQSHALQELMRANPSSELPPLFIVHSDAQELATLQPTLSTAKGVVLVKRPVITNALLEMIQNPEPHMGAHTLSSQARVRFAIPQVQTPVEERKHAFSSVPIEHPPDMEQRHTVLLVEDNMVSQHLGKRLLEKLGYEVVTAGNGQEAIDQVMQRSFLCCFMDCQMPVLDGFAATSKIRELENSDTLHRRLPIIALTANVSVESEEKCRAAGMDHFLPKPFRMGDFQATLTQIQNLTPNS